MSSQSKRHHFVPKFYLKGFAKDNSEQIYAHDKNKIAPFLTNLINCSVIQFYYSFEFEDGKKDDSVEKYLSDVEAKASVPIEMVKKGNFDLSNDHLSVLLYFFSLMMFRNPKFRNTVHETNVRMAERIVSMLASDKNLMASQIAAMERETGQKSKVNIDELMAFAKDQSRYKIEANPNGSLKVMIEVAGKIFELFSQMKWVFGISIKGKRFVVSDNPMGIANPKIPPGRPIGLAMKNTEIFFPIDKSTCLFGSWKDTSTITSPAYVPGFIVDNVNRAIIGNTTRFFYSSEPEPELMKIFPEIGMSPEIKDG